MSDWPPSLKPIGKFMARAREVEARDPIVAYYCNFYSLRKALELRDASDEAANRFVTGLLEKCESAKAVVGENDGSHQARVEDFALCVFDRADSEDRDDRATKATALTFYAAMCFLEVCSIFGPLSPELDERLRYAKWKAADITKALREGRKPVPGAPGEADARAEAENPLRQGAEINKAIVDPMNALHDPASVPPAPPVEEYHSNARGPTSKPDPSYQHQSYSDPTYPDPAYPPAPKYPSEEAPSPLPRSIGPTAPSYPTLDISAPPRDQTLPKPPTLYIPSIPPVGIYPPGTPQFTNAEVQSSMPPPKTEPSKNTTPPSIQQPVPVSEPVTVSQVAPVAAVPRAAADRQYKPNIKQTQEAQRLSKYAASALDFQDLKTAVANLEEALQLLTGRR